MIPSFHLPVLHSEASVGQGHYSCAQNELADHIWSILSQFLPEAKMKTHSFALFLFDPILEMRESYFRTQRLPKCAS